MLLSGKVERIPDCLADPEYVVPMGSLASNVRSLLGVPLLRKDGSRAPSSLRAPGPGDFSERQVGIVQTFADQAVIALENVRLFDEVQARTKELVASLNDLSKAQDRLIQSESSLPLVNSPPASPTKSRTRSTSSTILRLFRVNSWTNCAGPGKRAAGGGRPREAGDLIQMIDSNLEKVVSHGKRADSIVKNMLLHSREGSGERTESTSTRW